MKAYTTIVADPPWGYSTPGKIGASLTHRPNRDNTKLAGNAGSRSRYGSMSISEICACAPPSSENAHLYLWFTNRFACEAHTVARAWGFRPITILTWVKVKPDGTPSMKMGHYFRGATEHVVFAVRGSLDLQTNKALPTAFMWPRLPHSMKPDSFFEMVEEISPPDYLEMFARRSRPRWDAWGKEAPESIILDDDDEDLIG